MRNAYADYCYRCGKLVEAGKGHFERDKTKSFKKWRVQHADCAIRFRGTTRNVIKKMELKCPICSLDAVLTDSAIIYNGKSFGKIWACPNVVSCRCFVGIHRGTTKPLGFLADEQTRKWRGMAHKLFDAHWQSKGRHTRGRMYGWLATMLKLKEAHMGMMKMEDCQKVVSLMRDVELAYQIL